MIGTIIYLVALILGGGLIGYIVAKKHANADESETWSDGFDQGYSQGYDDGFQANIRRSIEV